MRIYAIGDIHGHILELKATHARIKADMERVGDTTAKIVHVGDYTDRGPASREVIEYLMDGIARGEPWICLRGNHDRLFTRFVRDMTAFDDNMPPELSFLNPRIGGNTTLASYGVTTVDYEFEAAFEAAQTAVPKEHLDFIEGLPLYYEWDKYLFVHAGIQPGVPLEQQSEEDLIWIRKGWLDYEGDLPWIVVHGHTAVNLPSQFGNRIDIDTGAGYGWPVTAIVIEGDTQEVVTDTGRAPLTKADPKTPAPFVKRVKATQ